MDNGDVTRREGVTQLCPRNPHPHYISIPTPKTTCNPTTNDDIKRISVEEYIENLLIEDNITLFGSKQKKVKNLTIAYHYVNVLHYPPIFEWEGKEGTVNTICNLLKIAKKKRRQVKVVLMQVIDRKLSGEEYTGSGY